jgi:hypothetical protein
MKTFKQLREETSIFEAVTAGDHKRDQMYASDYDTGRGQKHVDSAADHSHKSNYKVNHDFGGHLSGDAHGKKPPHKKPDVTMHYAHGDDEPNAYTVHHDGAAAHDKNLHKKAVHMGHADEY